MKNSQKERVHRISQKRVALKSRKEMAMSGPYTPQTYICNTKNGIWSRTRKVADIGGTEHFLKNKYNSGLTWAAVKCLGTSLGSVEHVFETLCYSEE